MHNFAAGPAKAYRRVELDARIEAAPAADLTRICLEEAISALGQALIAIERAPSDIPREALSRAQGIAVWLARSVAPDNPMRQALLDFYGGIAATIARNMSRARYGELAQVRADLADVLQAVSQEVR